MAYPAFLTRLKNFARDFLLGLTSPDAPGVDSELNQILEQVNAINLRLRGITDAAGNLRNLAVATAMSLAGAQRFSATASQTVFVTTIPWQSTFTALNVRVTAAGILLDPNTVTVADDGNDFLQVTIAAQALSTVVVVAAFEGGAGILTRLQDPSSGEGADLIAVNDAGGYFTSATQEGVDQEIGGMIAAIDATLTTLSTNAILKDGSVDFTGDQDMGGFKLTGLGAGTADSNDAARMADITQAALVAILGSYFSSTFLSLGGGTLTGDLDMGANSILNMADGVAVGDAVNVAQLALKVAKAGDTMTGDLLMDGIHKFTGLPTATNPSDAIPLSQAQALVSSLSTLVKTITPGTSSWVVPAGVTSIDVEVWGAGGGGLAGGSVDSRVGGGAGGYATARLPVTPGESLTLIVGLGGTGSGSPTDGGHSSVTRAVSALELVRANGGQEGVSGAGEGVGGTYTFDASVTGFGINGGRGDHLDVEGGTYNGGDGGDAPRGAQGGRGYRNNNGGGVVAAQDGQAPGGGGGGGDGGTSGDGADGCILIRY